MPLVPENHYKRTVSAGTQFELDRQIIKGPLVGPESTLTRSSPSSFGLTSSLSNPNEGTSLVFSKAEQLISGINIHSIKKKTGAMAFTMIFVNKFQEEAQSLLLSMPLGADARKDHYEKIL